MNSSGAAPVPPSVPSTTIKSGVRLVVSIALTKARNSQGCPTHNLKPTGLSPDRRLNSAMNSIIPIGVEKAECLTGETQSWPMGTSRMREISRVTFAAGNTPPWPGLALGQLDFDHLDLGSRRVSSESLRRERAVVIATTKVSRTDLPDQIAAVLQVIGTDTTLSRIVGKTAELGPFVKCPDGVGGHGPEA